LDALPFTEVGFYAIWFEGAVYNMGFEVGLSAWRRFLKPGAKLIVYGLKRLSATVRSRIVKASIKPERDSFR
jgi:hypothetical protein